MPNRNGKSLKQAWTVVIDVRRTGTVFAETEEEARQKTEFGFYWTSPSDRLDFVRIHSIEADPTVAPQVEEILPPLPPRRRRLK